jgi:hypothetical protein
MARKINATNTQERQQGGRGGRGYGRGGRNGGGRGRGGRFGRGHGSSKGKSATPNTSYYSPSEWSKLSFEERDKIRNERDKKGEQGGSKRSIGDLSVDQFKAIIGAVQQGTLTDKTADSSTDTGTSGNQAGNAFGGKESVKRFKVS